MECILIFTSQRAMDVNGTDLPWALANIPVYPIPVTSAKQFLIVYDEITDPGIITNVLLKTQVTMLYVMHHSKPPRQVLAALRAALDVLKIPYEYPFSQSEHSNANTYVKVPVIDRFVQNKQIDLLEQLFDEFKKQLSGDPVLEAKLNILHYLLITDPQTPASKKQLEKYIEEAGKNEEITVALAAFTTTSNSHFDRLLMLRDQLLNEY